MRVLGIDPGTATTGYGVVESDAAQKEEALDYGVIRTESDEPPARRLAVIYGAVTDLLNRHRPDALAVEQLFFNRNVRSALAVGQARGAVLLAAAHQGVPVLEYTPLQVKMAVAGYGRAEKQQIQAMVRAILRLGETPRPDDAADALAVALCCLHSLPLEERLGGGQA